MWGNSSNRSTSKRGAKNGFSANNEKDKAAADGQEFMLARAASHAGSWYTEDGTVLQRQLQSWLEDSGVHQDERVRAVIAPHAGYRYSGRCAAYAFAHICPSSLSRVFLMGPSHHHFTRRCMLTRTSTYSTPLGDVPVDLDVVRELRATGEFDDMSVDVDEAEHSLEMHLPYLVQAMAGRNFSLVPIVVGALMPATEAKYGRLLAKYLQDPANFFSISSDFCHWGTRFSYTPFERAAAQGGAIHASIQALDKEGMAAIEQGVAAPFTEYLSRTENTICGRHPIGVLLNMLEQLHEGSSTKANVRFVQYEQSSKCVTVRDSSVSYASAIVLLQK